MRDYNDREENYGSRSHQYRRRRNGDERNERNTDYSSSGAHMYGQVETGGSYGGSVHDHDRGRDPYNSDYGYYGQERGSSQGSGYGNDRYGSRGGYNDPGSSSGGSGSYGSAQSSGRGYGGYGEGSSYGSRSSQRDSENYRGSPGSYRTYEQMDYTSTERGPGHNWREYPGMGPAYGPNMGSANMGSAGISNTAYGRANYNTGSQQSGYDRDMSYGRGSSRDSGRGYGLSDHSTGTNYGRRGNSGYDHGSSRGAYSGDRSGYGSQGTYGGGTGSYRTARPEYRDSDHDRYGDHEDRNMFERMGDAIRDKWNDWTGHDEHERERERRYGRGERY